MGNSQPLLSICIPTYNRGYILKVVLEKYIQNREFDEDVEIIISDNCSSDDTQEMCLLYSRLKSNIHYYRNSENIRDRNFIKVLDYANGAYLKLQNDWVYYDESSLAFVKDMLKKNIERKIPVFFTDDVLFTKKKADVVKCNGLDDYVAVVSTFVTSNNIFGVWREQWASVKQKSKYSQLLLQQVDWTFQIVEQNNGCVLYNRKTLNVAPIKMNVRTGYNWFQVHLDYYYIIMYPYIEKGLINSGTLKEDKRNLLNHFRKELCYVYFYNFTTYWRFETKGTTKLLIKYYKNDPYILLTFLELPFYYIYILGGSIIRNCKGVFNIG